LLKFKLSENLSKPVSIAWLIVLEEDRMSLKNSKISRLDFLKVSGFAAAGLALTACGDNATPTVNSAATTAAATTATTTAAAATTGAAITTSTTTAAATTMTATTAAATTGGQAGGTMIGGFDVGPGGNFGIFNPMLAGAGFTWYNKYFSPLVLYDVGFTKIQGELAESWDISPDGKQFTFHLRKGVTWHDGQPFTSEDVKFSIDLLKNPDATARNAARYAIIQEVQTPDPQTAVFVLGQPGASLLDALTLALMYPKHSLGAIAPKDVIKATWWSTNPIGTGPFKWSKYVTDQYVELVAYDNYWRGRPKLDKLVDRNFTAAGSAVLALRSGDIQFSYATLDEANSLKSDQSIKVIGGPSQVPNFIAFNLKDPRFQDIKVRQAIMYAIDRKSILEQLYQGTGQIVNCIYNNPNYIPADIEPYAYDPAKAQSLLSAANWPSLKGSQPIELLTYYGDKLSADVMATMQQMLAAVGVTVVPRAVDAPTFNQILADGKFSMYFAGLSNGPDPDVVSQAYISTAVGPKQLGLNIPELDKLFAQGQQETDTAKRAVVYQNVCNTLNSQLPVDPLWVANRFGAVSNKIGNFIYTPAPGGGRYYDAAETWTIS
jgi:peptide/nickel transport system substrate-binding protein